MSCKYSWKKVDFLIFDVPHKDEDEECDDEDDYEWSEASLTVRNDDIAIICTDDPYYPYTWLHWKPPPPHPPP